MSSAGKCPKALSAIRLDMEPTAKPSWLDQTAEEGWWHEERIKDELKDRGYQVFKEQEEVTIENENFTLVGHIEARMYDLDKELLLLEVKSMSQFEFDRWMRGKFKEFPNYLAQISCYLNATDLPAVLYIVKNRNSGYKFEEIYDAQSNAFGIGDIIRKLEAIEEYVAKNELHPANFDPQSYECKRCEFKYLCVSPPKEINGVDKKILEVAIDRWREAKRIEAEAQKVIEESKMTLGNYADAQPEKKFTHNSLAVMKYSVHRESYDKKILLDLFDAKKLAPALKVSDYEALRIDDLENG